MNHSKPVVKPAVSAKIKLIVRAKNCIGIQLKWPQYKLSKGSAKHINSCSWTNWGR